jgi:hypothetical protein
LDRPTGFLGAESGSVLLVVVVVVVVVFVFLVLPPVMLFCRFPDFI